MSVTLSLRQLYRHHPFLKSFHLEVLKLSGVQYEVLLNTHPLMTALHRSFDPAIQAIQSTSKKQGCFFLHDVPVAGLREHTFCVIRQAPQTHTLLVYHRTESCTWVLSLTGDPHALDGAFAVQHLTHLFNALEDCIFWTREKEHRHTPRRAGYRSWKRWRLH